MVSKLRWRKCISFLLILCLCAAWSPLPGYATGTGGAGSLVPAGDFIPSVPIGTPTSNNYVSVDLGSYLSHVYDENKESARRWGGKIWNWLVNEDLCPEAYAQEVNGGLHHFVYGYTQRDGVAGYYNYCEYCGQFTGDIIQKSRPSGFGGTLGGTSLSNGKIISYGAPAWNISNTNGNPALSGFYRYYAYNQEEAYNFFDDDSIQSTGYYNSSGCGTALRSFGSKLLMNSGANETNNGKRGNFGIFIPKIDDTFTLVTNGITKFDSLRRLVIRGKISETPSIDSYTLLSEPTFTISQATFLNQQGYYLYVNSNPFGYYETTAPGFIGCIVEYNYRLIYAESARDNYLSDKSSVYYDTTYMTINAPISYNKVEGDTVNSYYGGTLNNYVDLGNNTLNFNNIDLGGMISGEISFDSYTYNYDNSTATFDLSNTDDSITISYGDEYTEIDYIQDGSVTEDVELYYITNLNSPINEVTIEPTIPLPTPEPTPTPGGSGGDGSGSGGTGGGNINANIDVNVNYPEVTVQVPIIADGQTQGVVTAPQNIPEGLYDIRESLAQGAGVIQEGSKGVATFIADGFTFLPENIRYMIGVGITFSVAAGIWHAFKG